MLVHLADPGDLPDIDPVKRGVGLLFLRPRQLGRQPEGTRLSPCPVTPGQVTYPGGMAVERISVTRKDLVVTYYK